MFTARQIAEFFLAHDDTGLLKDTTLITRNGRKFYRGNARLNKYLHIAQNMYIAKTGEKLFSDDLFAYDNGGVVPDVQEKYSILLNRNKQPDDFPDDVCVFLSRLMKMLKNASIDELIEISHEDEEWLDKCHFKDKKSQRMDSLSRAEEYKEQYADALFVLEGMG